jgi:hypothetical protein
MGNPEHLRELAARMFAVAMQSRDIDLARHLALRASDYLDQAAELERIAEKRSQAEESEKA